MTTLQICRLRLLLKVTALMLGIFKAQTIFSRADSDFVENDDNYGGDWTTSTSTKRPSMDSHPSGSDNDSDTVLQGADSMSNPKDHSNGKNGDGVDHRLLNIFLNTAIESLTSKTSSPSRKFGFLRSINNDDKGLFESEFDDEEMEAVSNKIFPLFNRETSDVLEGSLDPYDPVPPMHGLVETVNAMMDKELLKNRNKKFTVRELQQIDHRIRNPNQGAWEVPDMFVEMRQGAEAHRSKQNEEQLLTTLKRKGFYITPEALDEEFINSLPESDPLRRAVEEEGRIQRQRAVNGWLRQQSMLRNMWAEDSNDVPPTYHSLLRFSASDDNVHVDPDDDIGLNEFP